MKNKILIATLWIVICQFVIPVVLTAADPPIQSRFRETHQLMTQAGISSTDADTTINAMVRARFTERQMNRIGQTISSAPPGTAAAVRNKVHEGIAKGASADRIAAAAAAVAARHQTATRFANSLRTQHQAQHAAMYADSLAAGLTENDARALTDRLRTRSNQQNRNNDLVTQTLLTTRNMVRQGVSSKTTTQTIQNALQQNYSAREMQALRTSLEQYTGNMEHGAQALRDAIANGTRGDGLSSVGSAGASASHGGNSSSGNSGGGSGNSGGSGGSSGGSGGSSGGSGGSGGSGSGGSDGGSGGSGGGNGGAGGGGRS